MVAGRRRAGATVTVLLLAGAATACGGPGDDRVAAALRDHSSSPLEQLIVFDTADQATLDQREREAQAAIRDCMAEAGFVYVPPDPVGSDDGADAPGPDPDPDSPAFAADHGYGMADRARAELERDPAGATADDPARADPNEARRAALPAEERAAWDRALDGYGPGEIDLSSGRPVAVATGAELTRDEWRELVGDGCRPRAYAEAFDLATAEATGDLLRALEGRLADMEAAFRADPRVVELDDRWSGCMAGQGYRVSSREEAVAALEERFDEVVADAGAAGPVADGDTRLDGLAAEERALAVADRTCSEDLAAAAREIHREYEAALVEENEGLFVAYLDRIGR